MAFFDELSKKVQNVAYAATEKAQEVAAVAGEKANAVADRAKLEYAIATEKRSLDKNYRAVGEWYLSTIDAAPDAVADIVGAIRESKAKIAEMEAACAAPKAEEPVTEIKYCPNCGEPVSSRFCSKCGTEVQ